MCNNIYFGYENNMKRLQHQSNSAADRVAGPRTVLFKGIFLFFFKMQQYAFAPMPICHLHKIAPYHFAAFWQLAFPVKPKI